MLTTKHGRNVHDPRALAIVLEKAEADLAAKKHPDPYIGELSLYIRTNQPSDKDYLASGA